MPARVATYEGTVASFRTAGIGSANVNLLSLFNTTGSAVLVAVRRLVVIVEGNVDSGTLRSLGVSRLTTAPTDGTVLTKVPFDTALSSAANVVARGATASDGGAATTLTATPTTYWRRQFGDKSGSSSVGQREYYEHPFEPLGDLADEPLVLAAGEGLLVTVVDTGTTSHHYLVEVVFEEFTYAEEGLTVSPGLLGGYTLFAPTVSAGNVNVSPALLGGGSVLAPQVNQQVNGPALLGGYVLFAPVVAPGGVSSAPDLLGGATVFAPVLSPGGVVVSPALLGGSALFDPSVSGAGGTQTVEPELLGGGATFTPSVALATSQGLIDQTGLVFEPVLAVGGVTVSPDLLGGSVLYGPTIGIAGPQTVDVPLLGGSTLFDPAIAFGVIGHGGWASRPFRSLLIDDTHLAFPLIAHRARIFSPVITSVEFDDDLDYAELLFILA